MEEKSTATLEKIQEAALAEFLDKGFQGASLRQIVKNAGVTTGAFYGYFSSKEALFNALVEPHAAALMGKFMEAQTSFAELPEEQQPEHMGVESSNCVHWMVDYICQHREPVKLLLTRAEGTSYEHFVHNMVEVEVEYTLQYMEVLRRLGRDIPELSQSLCHIIASGMFNGSLRDRGSRYAPGAGPAGRGSAPGLLHRRMAEIDGGVASLRKSGCAIFSRRIARKMGLDSLRKSRPILREKCPFRGTPPRGPSLAPAGKFTLCRRKGRISI